MKLMEGESIQEGHVIALLCGQTSVCHSKSEREIKAEEEGPKGKQKEKLLELRAGN